MRISDGVKVTLKLVHVDIEELPIGLYFSSTVLQSDPRNHCVPILDVIPMPHNDIFAFIVMPLLLSFCHPPFERKIECIEAFQQMLEVVGWFDFSRSGLIVVACRDWSSYTNTT